jgi:hypothetical protein
MGAVAAAAAATLAAAGAMAMAPAFAATRPAGHAALARTAAHAKTSQHARRTLADVITTDFGAGGKYVTVVRCTGAVSSPPPVLLARLGDPLTVRGARPTAAVVKLLAKPKAYKPVYTCTVIVEEKAPAPAKKTHLVAKKSCALGSGRNWGGPWLGCRHVVVLNTGFGGEAGPVAGHHPAG